MSARASVRVSIAWSDAEAIEDTDTLVLTIDGYSLDLRVFVDGPEKGSVDWATVALVKEIEGSTNDNPILRWDHIIDSRPPTDLPDQGAFHTLPDGNVAETGIMFDPKTQIYEKYVETWKRLKQEKRAPYFVLRRDPSALIGGSEGVAFIGRMGSLALGIAKTEEGRFYAWRDQQKGDTWRRIYAFGDQNLTAWLPSLPVEVPIEWSKSQSVPLAEAAWTVEVIGAI